MGTFTLVYFGHPSVEFGIRALCESQFDGLSYAVDTLFGERFHVKVTASAEDLAQRVSSTLPDQYFASFTDGQALKNHLRDAATITRKYGWMWNSYWSVEPTNVDS